MQRCFPFDNDTHSIDGGCGSGEDVDVDDEDKLSFYGRSIRLDIQ